MKVRRGEKRKRNEGSKGKKDTGLIRSDDGKQNMG